MNHAGWANYVRLVTDGYDQGEIAKRSGVAQGTISRWLGGKHSPGRPANVAALAQAFDREVLEAFVMAGFLTYEAAEKGLSPVARRQVQELLAAERA